MVLVSPFFIWAETCQHISPSVAQIQPFILYIVTAALSKQPDENEQCDAEYCCHSG